MARRDNGTGCIRKCKDKKRKSPFRVTITVGTEINPVTGKAKQITRSLGYFKTRKDAEEAIANYFNKPYNLDVKNMTFTQLYQLWLPIYLKDNVTSADYERSIRSAYNYSASLHARKIRDLRATDFEDCMNNAYIIETTGKNKGQKKYASANTKTRMKSLFNLMFDYAVKYEYVFANYARNFKIDKKILKEVKKERRINPAFSYKDFMLLWKAYEFGIEFADMVLIQIYTGFRADELVEIKKKNVFLDLDVMMGGKKTEAGENRYVPIHPKIKPLVEARYKLAVEHNKDFLFFDLNAQRGTTMTYDKYRRRFNKVMNAIGTNIDYTTHCCRVTFITLAKAYNIDKHLLKLIVGHSDPDITERIYTRRLINALVEAVNLIPMEVDEKFLAEDTIKAIIEESINAREHLFD